MESREKYVKKNINTRSVSIPRL